MSPTKKVLVSKTRIPNSKLEDFLLDLVNAQVAESGDDLTGTRDDTGRIFRLYEWYLPHPPSTPEEATPLLSRFSDYWAKSGEPLPKEPEVYKRGIIAGFRDLLRVIWEPEDEYTAEWRLFHLQWGMAEVMTAGSYAEPLPPETPLSQALNFLWRELGLRRKCPNPKCPRRFFIAARREQQVCGLESCIKFQQSEPQKASWRRRLHKVDEGKQPEGEPLATEGRVNSNQIQRDQPSIDEPAVQAFILDVANADDNKILGDEMYFFTRYPEFFPTKESDIEAALPMFRRKWSTLEGLRMEVPRIYHRAAMSTLRDGLRDAWQAKHDATAVLHIYRAQNTMHGIMDVHSRQNWLLQPPSVDNPIQRALRWVRKNLAKLKECGNDDCHRNPFFVATGKKLYCSDQCKAVGKKASKRRSWKKHGKEWRPEQAREKDGHKPSTPKGKKR